MSVLAATASSALDLPGLPADAARYEQQILDKAPPQPNEQAQAVARTRAAAAAKTGNWQAAAAAFTDAIRAGARQGADWAALADALAKAGTRLPGEKLPGEKAGTRPPGGQAAVAQTPSIDAYAAQALLASWLAYINADTTESNTTALVRIGTLLQDRMNRPGQALDAFKEA
ncbi:MAG TPA: hypothetical protein VGN75_16015, partial [Kaistia sp.]|nr:hypothetical protein [Kaistia sp.]